MKKTTVHRKAQPNKGLRTTGETASSINSVIRRQPSDAERRRDEDRHIRRVSLELAISAAGHNPAPASERDIVKAARAFRNFIKAAR